MYKQYDAAYIMWDSVVYKYSEPEKISFIRYGKSGKEFNSGSEIRDKDGKLIKKFRVDKNGVRGIVDYEYNDKGVPLKVLTSLPDLNQWSSVEYTYEYYESGH